MPTSERLGAIPDFPLLSVITLAYLSRTLANHFSIVLLSRFSRTDETGAGSTWGIQLHNRLDRYNTNLPVVSS